MESFEIAIIAKARELSEALKDFAYTRKDEDKRRVRELETELMKLCSHV